MRALEAFQHWVQIKPDKLAHVSGVRQTTYAELASRSDAVAAHLRKFGGPRQTPVAVVGHKEPEMLQAFLGCLKAGHPYAPIDTSLPENRVASIHSRLQPGLTLTPELISRIPDADAVSDPVRSEEIAYIIFTSGSTGEPKGVPILARSLDLFVDWILAEHALGEEVFLNQAPFCFDLSVMDLYPCLVSGGRLFSLTKDVMSDPNRLPPVFKESGLTTWVSTPSFARMCIADKNFHAEMLPHLRRFMFCGETLPPALSEELMERFPLAEVWNTYGPTEATVATTSVRLTRELLQRYESVPVGYPMKGSIIRVLDDKLVEVPEGEKGEIVISGPHVSPGYFASTLKESPFLLMDGHWSYRTGDWGRFRDGLLFFEGRMDNQIKLNGYRIELGDMEANLCALEGVRDAVVLPDMQNGEVASVTAYIIPSAPVSSGGTGFILSLRSALRQRVPDYMIPRRFILREVFPVTINGKVDRAKLAQGIL